MRGVAVAVIVNLLLYLSRDVCILAHGFALIFAKIGIIYAFSAMDENLQIPPPFGGHVISNSTIREWQMHRHSELEANLVIRGSARYLMHDRTYILTPGTIVWLFPKQYHLLLDQSADHCQWTVVVRPELLREICTTPQCQTLLESNPDGYFCKRLDHGDAMRLHALLTEVHSSKIDVARYNAGLAYAVLSLWAAYTRTPEQASGVTIHPAVDKAVVIITEQPQLRVDEIAQRCGLSASQLSRVFGAQIGMSLVHFRNRQGVARFFQLYEQGQYRSMQQVAVEAGFGSYSQFHRVFHHLIGCSPAAWQRSLKNRRTARDDGSFSSLG
jgi:AraC-like DNA-binding protein